MQKAWRLYEHIPQIDYIYLWGILIGFSTELGKFGIKNSTNEVLGTMEKFDGDFYFYPDEYHKTQKDILGRVIKNPDWGIRFNKKLNKLLDDYFKIAKEVWKSNLEKLSNE